MEVRIKDGNGYVDAEWTIEDGVMVVSPKEVKFEPKDGDVCCSSDYIYIYKSLRDDKAIVYHCVIRKDGEELFIIEGVGVGYIYRDCNRFATEEEKKLLFDKLAEEGLDWDVERKELVKLKWKPKVNEEFYYPSYIDGGSFEASVSHYDEQSDIDDDLDVQNGMCFKTEQECQDFCNRLNEAINQVKP